MTHVSASAFCVWSVLSTALGAFLVGHLWRFDRFRCLRWSNSPYSGAFKRIMTYTYLISIPLIMVYSFGFAYIKYAEGFLTVAGETYVKPYTLWDEKHRRMIFPLMMTFSFAWSFEMITHLEELCFWLFLISAGPSQPDWFKSPFFRLWAIGSVFAFVYIPAVAIGYRPNPLTCEAHTFFAGSLGDLVLTLAFVPILFKFPEFLRRVKAEGVDASVVIRLSKFFELNVVRVIFRFLMIIPLLILGSDGLRAPHYHINESMFWVDLLSITAALGCVFSSVCTLLIFFPRSYETEYQVKLASARHSAYSPSSKHEGDVHPPTLTAMSPALEDSDDKPISYEDLQQTESFSSGKRLMSSKSHQLLRLPDSFKRLEEPVAITPFVVSTLPFSSDSSRAEDNGTRDEEEGRGLHQQNQAGSLRTENREKPLKRKGTYLLTDSPVLRAQRLREQEANAAIEHSVSYPPEPPYSAGSTFRPPPREKAEDRDIGNLVLDDIPLSQSPVVLSPNRKEDFEHPPRTPASINSTLTTRSGRRRLPSPPSPQSVPAPAYYPPGGVPMDEPLADVKVASPEGVLSPVYGAGSVFLPTLSHPLSSNIFSNPTSGASAPRPPYTREASDMNVQDAGSEVAKGSTTAAVGTSHATRRPKRVQTETDNLRKPAKPSAGPLTAANVNRLNEAGRSSQLNPLIRTFSSPIDFMGRAHANGSGSRAHRGGDAV